MWMCAVGLIWGVLVVMLGVVVLARREMAGLEREVQGLGRLRYGLKGA